MATEESGGGFGFNGNYEKWFAKDEPKHKVKLEPEMDVRAGSNELRRREIKKETIIQQ